MRTFRQKLEAKRRNHPPFRSDQMVNKKKGNFFLTLPKKELQALCRKYGLPSYKSKRYLAEDLAHMVPSPGMQEKFVQIGLNRKCADTSCSQSFECDDSHLDLNALPRKYMGTRRCGRTGKLPSVSKLPADNASIESVRNIEVSPPTFEFHVRSEEGISLYVDLNSTPSEWAESLKKNIWIPGSSSCTKSQRLHEDLGHFGGSTGHLKDSDPRTVNETNVDRPPYGTTLHSENKLNSCEDFDCLDRVDGSLMASVEVLRTTDVGFSKCKEEGNGVSVFPKSSSCGQNQILVSASSDDPKIDYVGDSVSNSVSDGAISFLTSEQPLEVITEECGDSPVRYNCIPSYLGSTMHERSVFTSVEEQLSEAAGLQKDKAPPYRSNGTGLVDRNCNLESEQGESANSSEVDHGRERNQVLICSDKEERSCTGAVEISECSQFEKSYERNSPITDDLDSSGYFLKRKSTDGVEGNGFSNPEARKLRRTHHLSGQVLPRRSMRDQLMSCAQTT